MPYVHGTIKFIEDAFAPMPVHRTTMREEMELNGVNNNAKGLINDIKEFTEVNNVKLPKDGPNLFMNANAIVAHNISYINAGNNKIFNNKIMAKRIC